MTTRKTTTAATDPAAAGATWFALLDGIERFGADAQAAARTGALDPDQLGIISECVGHVRSALLAGRPGRPPTADS